MHDPLNNEAQEFFDNLVASNTLKTLDQSDKTHLFVFLKYYQLMKDSDGNSVDAQIERLHKLAGQASILAAALEKELASGEIWEVLGPEFATYVTLPAQLKAFAEQLNWLL